MARRHLAIFLKGFAEKILSGQKQVEVRLSQNRVLPYLSVQKGDEIFLKNSGRKIIGKVMVDNVLYYEKINADIFNQIKKNYYSLTGADNTFWQAKKRSHFATIIFLKNPQKFLTPVIYKKHDRRPWVIIDK